MDKKITVAFVNVMDGYSGGEIVLKRLIEGLDNGEFEKILYTRATPLAEYVDKKSCAIRVIKHQYQLRKRRGLPALFKAAKLFVVSLGYAIEMKRNGVEIVHSNSLTSSIYFAGWSKLLGMKFVAHNHLIRSGLVYKVLYKYIELCSDRIICVSEAVKRCWVDHGVLPAKIEVIYNGLPDDFFKYQFD